MGWDTEREGGIKGEVKKRRKRKKKEKRKRRRQQKKGGKDVAIPYNEYLWRQSCRFTTSFRRIFFPLWEEKRYSPLELNGQSCPPAQAHSPCDSGLLDSPFVPFFIVLLLTFSLSRISNDNLIFNSAQLSSKGTKQREEERRRISGR